jgi:hypothetical protein
MKCAACPVEVGKPCLAESEPRHSGLCAWATSADPVLVAHIAALAGPRPEPHCRQVATNVPPASSPIADRHLAILSCEYRIDPVGLEKSCGCTIETRCLMLKGLRQPGDPSLVTYSDCMECMKG